MEKHFYLVIYVHSGHLGMLRIWAPTTKPTDVHVSEECAEVWSVLLHDCGKKDVMLLAKGPKYVERSEKFPWAGV